jgi:hypothetical protein
VTKGVQYSEPLIRSMEDSLKLAFDPYLMLSRQPDNSGNEFDVRLVNTSVIARLDNGEEQGVLEIVTVGKSDTFYLAFVSPFDLTHFNKKGKKQYSLHSVSLTVFHRVLSDLVPMFRAEWDNQDASSDSPHSQPHWHFVQSPERIEHIVRARLGADDQGLDFNPAQPENGLFSEIADCGRFHFAMMPLWGRADAPALKRVFDSDDFQKWFAGMSKYIAKQLDYIAGKMPAAALAFTPHNLDEMEGVMPK